MLTLGLTKLKQKGVSLKMHFVLMVFRVLFSILSTTFCEVILVDHLKFSDCGILSAL